MTIIRDLFRVRFMMFFDRPVCVCMTPGAVGLFVIL